MKKSIAVLNILIWSLIIVICIIWLVNCISGYFSLKDLNYYDDLSFGQFLFATYQGSINFFAPLLMILFGLYRIAYVLLSTDFGLSSKEKAIASLSQYKSLLDTGIITQEEFDAKKKELLGL